VISFSNSENYLKSKKCIKCNKYPTIQRRHSGQFLCLDCFKLSVEKIISKTVSKYNMLNPNDNIIVALSESKNSIILLYILKKIQEKVYRPKPIIALSIDDNNNIKLTRELCEKLSIEQVIINSNEIVEDEPFLQQLLKIASIDLGGNILALGYNLTNLANIYLNQLIFSKDPSQRIYYQDDYIKTITPLMRIPKEEIDIYFKIKNMGISKDLKYKKGDNSTIKIYIENFINDCKIYSPEIEYNLLNGFLELLKISDNQ
jgi:tRNA(Ile)-lysidine synthase TilS/MesJ